MPNTVYPGPRVCACGFQTLNASSWCRHKKSCVNFEACSIKSTIEENNRLLEENNRLHQHFDMMNQLIKSKDDQVTYLTTELNRLQGQIKHDNERHRVIQDDYARLTRQNAQLTRVLLNKNRPKITDTQRQRVFERCGGQCAQCGVQVTAPRFDIDHIVPLADGGGNEDSNLQVLCLDHHREKSVRENQGR